MAPDKFHGQGGTFTVNAQGERERARDADGREIKPGDPHPEGDRARDAGGKPFEKSLDAVAVAPALPKPAESPPWAGERAPVPAADAGAGDSPRRKRGG
jgi:hypothetical protein